MMPTVTKGLAGKCVAQQLRVIMITRDAEHGTTAGGECLFDPDITVRIIVYYITGEQYDIHLG